MRLRNERIQLSASDLAKHLACRHLTMLDLLVARKELKRIFRNDPGRDALEERGMRHEADYLAHLKEKGYEVLEQVDGGFERTFDAMKRGVQVIAQADLELDNWRGRADILFRVETPSKLGNWSYEVIDTKLSRETKGGTILQLCVYSELLEKIQECMPESMHVIKPGRNFEPETFRVKDYLAYYRFVKRNLENNTDEPQPIQTYPESVEHCEICDWWPLCNDRRRKDDHLAFVAGSSKLQIGELRNVGINTLANLANMILPLEFRPKRGSVESFIKIREQARLQFQYRTNGKPVYELLDLEPEHGLARLPEPSQGDIFLDFESDPFVDERGIEYLLGYVALNDAGEANYKAHWAFDRMNEKQMFETFMDMVMERRSRFPELHIYHFSHYEPTALKRLMGRYASKEDEMDRLLTAGVFIDLYGVLKQTLRASVERYSLKDLEIFFGFERKTDLRDASRDKQTLECALELNNIDSLPSEILQTVEAYNREDCFATLYLRNWLENVRADVLRDGKEIQRPVSRTGDPSEAVGERRQQVLLLMERLLRDVPVDPSEQTPEQRAVWLIAHMLEWHRRELKATWWEFFRLRELSDDELLRERVAISGMQFVKRAGGTDTCPIHRYRFPVQDTEIREGDSLETSKGKFGTVIAIDAARLMIDVKKRRDTAKLHPTSVFAFDFIQDEVRPESLLRLGAWIANNGIDAPGKYRAARDLLLRKIPRMNNDGSQFCRQEVEIVSEARRIVLELDGGLFPIQGPPGAGKTFAGAQMICELLKNKKKVGITALSHKVIRKLIEEAVEAARKEKIRTRCMQKVGEESEVQNRFIQETSNNEDIISGLRDGSVQLAGGTGWLWSRQEYAEAVDVLFVDEAGQMSLADVLAVSQAAKNVVLLGDPQQLEQPVQGTHPPGVAASALQHILGENQTMPAELGLFLDKTWRLCPAICNLTSELFYESKLNPREQLAQQKLMGSKLFDGSGLWFVPVKHEGNQSSCDEEADRIAEIVKELNRPGVSWVDEKGESKPLTLNDILIVAPYNAQVFKIAARIAGARVGTVDKFQGQEAPVVIYSLTTSSPEEAPHGMEFLYSLNRFNVATSRAKCACILVASPRLFEPECKTPHQMKLANALCRYLELATTTD